MPIKTKSTKECKNFDFQDTAFARSQVAPVPKTVLYDSSDGVNSIVAQRLAEIKKKRDAEKLTDAVNKAAEVEEAERALNKPIKSKVGITYSKIDIDKMRASKAEDSIMNFRETSMKNQDTLKIAE